MENAYFLPYLRTETQGTPLQERNQKNSILAFAYILICQNALSIFGFLCYIYYYYKSIGIDIENGSFEPQNWPKNGQLVHLNH